MTAALGGGQLESFDFSIEQFSFSYEEVHGAIDSRDRGLVAAYDFFDHFDGAEHLFGAAGLFVGSDFYLLNRSGQLVHGFGYVLGDAGLLTGGPADLFSKLAHMKGALADMARGESLFAGCALDAAGLLSYEVDGFKYIVALGSLYGGSISDRSDALGSGDSFFSYVAKQYRGARGQLDAVGGPLTAHSNAFYRFGDVLSDRFDELFYLARGSGCALAEFLDFVGNNPKAAALGAGLGGEDRSIEGQEVRPIGDFVDDVGDVSDLI